MFVQHNGVSLPLFLASSGPSVQAPPQQQQQQPQQLYHQLQFHDTAAGCGAASTAMRAALQQQHLQREREAQWCQLQQLHLQQRQQLHQLIAEKAARCSGNAAGLHLRPLQQQQEALAPAPPLQQQQQQHLSLPPLTKGAASHHNGGPFFQQREQQQQQHPVPVVAVAAAASPPRQTPLQAPSAQPSVEGRRGSLGGEVGSGAPSAAGRDAWGQRCDAAQPGLAPPPSPRLCRAPSSPGARAMPSTSSYPHSPQGSVCTTQEDSGSDPRTSPDATRAPTPAPPQPQPQRMHSTADGRMSVNGGPTTVTCAPAAFATAAAAAAAGGSAGDTKRVLVAKALTKSDAHTRRLILPRKAVEANLREAIGRPAYSFEVHDAHSNQWTFVIRSWPNGANPKPVYVLEHISDYVKAYGVSAGDVLGLCETPHGLVVEVNTEAVIVAARRSASVKTKTRTARRGDGRPPQPYAPTLPALHAAAVFLPPTLARTLSEREKVRARLAPNACARDCERQA